MPNKPDHEQKRENAGKNRNPDSSASDKFSRGVFIHIKTAVANWDKNSPCDHATKNPALMAAKIFQLLGRSGTGRMAFRKLAHQSVLLMEDCRSAHDI
jgi:hypothetical protein